jgi:hypothetical protein
MKTLREQIKAEQQAAGVCVIQPPHALGFFDPHLPAFEQYPRHLSDCEAKAGAQKEAREQPAEVVGAGE